MEKLWTMTSGIVEVCRTEAGFGFAARRVVLSQNGTSRAVARLDLNSQVCLPRDGDVLLFVLLVLFLFQFPFLLKGMLGFLFLFLLSFIFFTSVTHVVLLSVSYGTLSQISIIVREKSWCVGKPAFSIQPK